MANASLHTNGDVISVNIEGLAELIQWTKTADAKLKRAMVKGLKEASGPVLNRARANASAIAYRGTYTGSLSIASRKSGAEIVLKSTDPAAGVKEFARRGSYYRVKYGDKRRNARKMRYFPVGAPRRANPPRVMIPAVNDSSEEIMLDLVNAIDRVLEEAGRG